MDLSILNEKQKFAVTAPLGPVLVLAGAGSGKTRALSYRIAYLCDEKIVEPGNILALTFTNKAAKEMAERVRNILSDQPLAIPFMGTFHSICAKMLRQEISLLGYTRSFTIYDSDDQAKVVKEIIGDLHIDKRFSPSLFRTFISQAKNILQSPGEFSIGLSPDMHTLVKEVYTRYQNYLFQQNALDFDDLLMLMVKILQNSPAVLAKYRNLFKYILVDEYQDTNHAQYVFLYILAEEHHNLFVVGDDAQSIYGFRGSNIRNILNFEQDFPEAVVIKLEQNYRSSQNILGVAQKVIEMNPEQKAKILWTENQPGTKIAVVETSDEVGEAQFVAKKIIEYSSSLSQGTGESSSEIQELEYEEEDAPVFSILDQFLKKQKTTAGRRIGSALLPQLPKDHGNLNEFAILFRTHSQSRALEEIFIESDIPYRIIGGLRFYERKEIKDVLAYLRLAQNYRDLMSLKRVLNEPARGIGDRTYSQIKNLITKNVIDMASGIEPMKLSVFRESLASLNLGPKIQNSVTDFFALIDRLASLQPEEDVSALLHLIIKRTKFDEWLRDGTEQGEARWENVQELFTVVEKFKTMPWKEGLENFLEEVALITEIDAADDATDAVTLMTFHSAKGLEFDTVFLVGLEEGILPHSRALLNPAELPKKLG